MVLKELLLNFFFCLRKLERVKDSLYLIWIVKEPRHSKIVSHLYGVLKGLNL